MRRPPPIPLCLYARYIYNADPLLKRLALEMVEGKRAPAWGVVAFLATGQANTVLQGEARWRWFAEGTKAQAAALQEEAQSWVPEPDAGKVHDLADYRGEEARP